MKCHCHHFLCEKTSSPRDWETPKIRSKNGGGSPRDVAWAQSRWPPSSLQTTTLTTRGSRHKVRAPSGRTHRLGTLPTSPLPAHWILKCDLQNLMYILCDSNEVCVHSSHCFKLNLLSSCPSERGRNGPNARVSVSTEASASFFSVSLCQGKGRRPFRLLYYINVLSLWTPAPNGDTLSNYLLSHLIFHHRAQHWHHPRRSQTLLCVSPLCA